MKLQMIGAICLVLFLGGCTSKYPYQIDTKNLPTHNPAVFAQGRYCNDYLKFECLPESHDPSILQGNEPLDEGKSFYDYDEKKYREYGLIMGVEDPKEGEKVKNYTLKPEDYKWMTKTSLKAWYKEMETTMEKQYPGFWGETPRSVRHRWMRLCVVKGHKYGYGLETERVNEKGEVLHFNPERPDEWDNYPIVRLVLDKDGKPQAREGAVREMQQWIELCGRIGLNFDRDPKWQYIVDFIKHPDSVSMGHAGEAVRYIDFTVFQKDYTKTGTKMTDWSLRTPLSHLPYPNRRVPSINDPE